MTIKEICETAGLTSYLGATAENTYVEKEARAFDQQGIDNRVNTSWKRAENIVISSTDGILKKTLLLQWVKLTDNGKHKQKLYYPIGDGVFELYGADGVLKATDVLENIISVHTVPTLGMSVASSGEGGNVLYEMLLAAIRTKPFILLAGISGTGKSRLVRQLATGCCPAGNRLAWDDDAKTKPAKKPGNFEMIQVRPNWHDSTQLMGYESRATGHHEYVITPFVSFLAKAWKNLDVPFFLCLDEMNLAPVEQYFAEYLSVIETRKLVGDEIVTDPLVRIEDKDLFEGVLNKLFEAGTDSALVERFKREGGISIPQNLVVMGTVNMDETTFSFSRKVLDRAMSFELNEVDMNGGLEQCPDCGYGTILPEHAKCEFTQGYEVYAVAKDPCDKIKEFLSGVNKLLDKTPFKIAYRTRNEIMIYCHERTKNNVVSLAQALDEATSMKILSRIEGDKRRLVIRDEDYQEYNGRPLLESLGEVILKGLKAVRGGDSDYAESKVCKVKLSEMIGQLANGYTSFWTR